MSEEFSEGQALWIFLSSGAPEVRSSPSCLLCVTQTQRESVANFSQNQQRYPTQLGTGPASSGLDVSIISHIYFKNPDGNVLSF